MRTNEIGGGRGGRRWYVEEREVKIGANLRRYQVYAWGNGIIFFRIYGSECTLMQMWLVGVPQNFTPSFSMFQDGRELEHFPRGRRKYN